MTPGSSCIDTPAIPFEIGSCSTVTSFPKLFPRTFPFDFSNSNLNVGNSFPDNNGSGRLFRKLLSLITRLFKAIPLEAIKRILTSFPWTRKAVIPKNPRAKGALQLKVRQPHEDSRQRLASVA